MKELEEEEKKMVSTNPSTSTTQSQSKQDSIKDDEQRHEKAVYRWKLAVISIMKINRATQVFKKSAGAEKTNQTVNET